MKSIAETPDEPLVKALQSLYRAYQKTSIYPPGHPAVPEALGSAATDFAHALGDRDSIEIIVTRDQLSVEGNSLAETSGATKSLALLFHDLDVALVRFTRQLTIDELHAFVHTLGQARSDSVKGSALVGLLEEQEFEHLEVVQLDYERLPFAEGARSGQPGDTRERVLGNLNSMISELAKADAVIQPEQLARRVNEEIEQQEGTGVGTLRKRIRGVSRKINALEPVKREEGRDRMAGFVAALNPELRADLLRVGLKTPNESLLLMTELADVLPEPDLLDALQDIDKARARVPEQMLTLLNKLVRISSERPTLRAGLRDTLQNWGVSSDLLDGETPDLRSALREVFRSRGKIDPNPKPYQALLDDLSRQELEQTTVPLESRYRDPTDDGDVHLQAAEVAVQVLGKAGGERHRAGLLGYIDTMGNQLLEHGRFEAMRDAAISARSYSLLKKQAADTKLAAAGFLQGFSRESRVRTVLQHACKGSSIPDAAISLVRLGKTPALEVVLEFLDRKYPVEITKSLLGLVIESGPEQVGALMRNRSAAGWPLLRPLFPALLGLPATGAVPLLEELTSHHESRVRRETMVALCDIDCRPSSPEVHLKRGLRDSDKRLVAVAVQRLLHLNTKRSIALLGQYFRGEITDVAPSPSAAVDLAQALAVTGQHGLSELCATLDSLRWTVSGDKTSMASSIADALSLHAKNPGVARCIGRWRRSPAHLLTRAVPAVFRRVDGGK